MGRQRTRSHSLSLSLYLSVSLSHCLSLSLSLSLCISLSLFLCLRLCLSLSLSLSLCRSLCFSLSLALLVYVKIDILFVLQGVRSLTQHGSPSGFQPYTKTYNSVNPPWRKKGRENDKKRNLISRTYFKIFLFQIQTKSSQDFKTNH